LFGERGSWPAARAGIDESQVSGEKRRLMVKAPRPSPALPGRESQPAARRRIGESAASTREKRQRGSCRRCGLLVLSAAIRRWCSR